MVLWIVCSGISGSLVSGIGTYLVSDRGSNTRNDRLADQYSKMSRPILVLRLMLMLIPLYVAAMLSFLVGFIDGNSVFFLSIGTFEIGITVGWFILLLVMRSKRKNELGSG